MRVRQAQHANRLWCAHLHHFPADPSRRRLRLSFSSHSSLSFTLSSCSFVVILSCGVILSGALSATRLGSQSGVEGSLFVCGLRRAVSPKAPPLFFLATRHQPLATAFHAVILSECCSRSVEDREMSRRISLRVRTSPSSLAEGSASVFSSHSSPAIRHCLSRCHPERMLFAIRRGSRNESKDLSSCADFAEQSRRRLRLCFF